MGKLMRLINQSSSYAGLAGIIGGLGMIFDINEAAPLAEAVAQGGIHVASGNLVFGLGTILAGAIAVFRDEKK